MKRILVAFSIIGLAICSSTMIAQTDDNNSRSKNNMNMQNNNMNMQNSNQNTRTMSNTSMSLSDADIKAVNKTMWTCKTNASFAASGSAEAQADEDMENNPRPAVNAYVFALQHCRDCTKITCYLSNNQMNTGTGTTGTMNNQTTGTTSNNGTTGNNDSATGTTGNTGGTDSSSGNTGTNRNY